MLATDTPFPQYFDLAGRPLTSGYLYFGAVGANPETSPITVYWDEAGTQPAAQPIRTVGGYVVRSGTPARLFVGSSYSLTVRDSRKNLIATSSINSLEMALATAGATTGAELVSYLATGTGAVPTSVQRRLRREVWAEDFGADPAATAAANYTAFTAAIAAVSSRGGTVRYGIGTFDLSATLVINAPNITLGGAGGSGDNIAVSGASMLRATHTAGPVVRITRLGCSLLDMVLTSDTARYTGAAGSNYGLLVESIDGTGNSVARTTVRRVRVTNQKTHGVLMIANCVSSTLDMVDVDNVGGHGIVINCGNITGRVNISRPGQVNIDNCRASRTGGHTLVVGDQLTVLGTPDATKDREALERPYRVLVNNFESFYGYNDPAVCYGAYEVYVYGENHEFQGCAFSGLPFASVPAGPGGVPPAVLNDNHKCLYVAGQNIKFGNQRFVDGNPRAADVVDRAALGGPPLMVTAEIKFELAYINNSGRTAFYNPAIQVDATCKSVSVVSSTGNSDVVSLVSVGSINQSIDEGGLRRFNGAYVGTGFCSVASSITLADDQAGYWQFPAAGDISIAAVSGNTSGAGGAMLHFRVGDANAFCWPSSFTGGTATSTGIGTQVTGVGAGTAGAGANVDGNLCFSADTATNRLYMKNRTGASRAYEVTFLNSRETFSTFVTV